MKGSASEMKGPFHAGAPFLYDEAPLSCRGPLSSRGLTSAIKGFFFGNQGAPLRKPRESFHATGPVVVYDGARFWAAGTLGTLGPSELKGPHFGNQGPFHAVGFMFCIMGPVWVTGPRYRAHFEHKELC